MAIEIPEKFEKIIRDFMGDLTMTFPEYEMLIKKFFLKPDWIQSMYAHCLTVFPERFMDILYKNVEIFSAESKVNTDFLPGISFRYLWQCDITDATKETIWRYLQLISVTLVAKGTADFSDTANIFDAINETEFKEKLAETLEKMQTMFTGPNAEDPPAEPAPSMSDDEDGEPSMNEHMQGIMGGKLGDLAREIAEETAGNFTEDMENVTDANEVFQKLFKNPGKLMGLVKNVGEKLDSRIKSGDINESELLSEATELMGKMKNMPGMDNIQEMMAKMGLGKKAKVNTAAMGAKMAQLEKSEQLKEQIRKNAEERRAKASAVSTPPPATGPSLTDEQLISIFSTGEKVEKTPVGSNPAKSTGKGKGKGKGKSKK